MERLWLCQRRLWLRWWCCWRFRAGARAGRAEPAAFDPDKTAPFAEFVRELPARVLLALFDTAEQKAARKGGKTQ